MNEQQEKPEVAGGSARAVDPRTRHETRIGKYQIQIEIPQTLAKLAHPHSDHKALPDISIQDEEGEVVTWVTGRTKPTSVESSTRTRCTNGRLNARTSTRRRYAKSP